MPFEIDKRLVYEAYKAVRSNKGSAGIDGIEMTSYEENMSSNLYKLWNRMSSGCYFPKAVKLVEIPKSNGGTRPLGIPTIEDRIAQMTVVLAIAPRVDPLFHEDSYGYRPNKSAHNAVPQGSVIGPVLSNLFLHYVFDKWMLMNYPAIPFERYADDTICHCWTEKQAQYLKASLIERFEECGLRLNEEKTKIVYCKDSNRRGNSEHTSFDFLGFTYRPREAKNTQTGQVFTAFLPAISNKSAMRIKTEIRNWNLNRQLQAGIKKIAENMAPKVRGWINYYSKFGKTEIGKVMKYLNAKLARWVKRKHKRFRGGQGKLLKAQEWLAKVASYDRTLFVHWTYGYIPYPRKT